MKKEEQILALGFEGTVLFKDCDYIDALIGVTMEGRAVYDYAKMVKYLVEKEGIEEADAIEWIDYNTLGALPYAGKDAPIVAYILDDEPEDKSKEQDKKYIQGNKVYSYSTLKKYRKDELIDHIRILEHNWADSEERLDRQAKNFDKLLAAEAKRVALDILSDLYTAMPRTQVVTKIKKKYGVEIKK